MSWSARPGRCWRGGARRSLVVCGDELSYWVEYSTDDGATYETVASNYRATTLTVDRGRPAGSDNAMVRVTASDGLRSAAADSAAFTVANNAPEVFIHSPAQGSMHAGLASIVVHATAYDPEDGSIDASAVSWSSSIDGQIATGGVAVIDTGDLTAGTHVLTATAIDSDGTTGSETVTVTFKETSDPPVAVDDTAYGRAGATVGVDAATTAEQIASAPARWVTSGADGTAEETLAYGQSYVFCAVAAGVEDVIAGCSDTGSAGSLTADARFVGDAAVGSMTT